MPFSTSSLSLHASLVHSCDIFLSPELLVRAAVNHLHTVSHLKLGSAVL